MYRRIPWTIVCREIENFLHFKYPGPDWQNAFLSQSLRKIKYKTTLVGNKDEGRYSYTGYRTILFN